MRPPFAFVRPLAAVAAAALALGLSLPAPLAAAVVDTQPRDSVCPGVAVQVVAAVLQLSPEQVEAFVTILGNESQALVPLMTQIQQHQQVLMTLLGSGNPDPATVGQLLIELHALEGQVHVVQAEALAQFRHVLGPPQSRILDQVRQAARLSPIVPAFVATGLVTDELPANLLKRVGDKLPPKNKLGLGLR